MWLLTEPAVGRHKSRGHSGSNTTVETVQRVFAEGVDIAICEMRHHYFEGLPQHSTAPLDGIQVLAGKRQQCVPPLVELAGRAGEGGIEPEEPPKVGRVSATAEKKKTEGNEL